MLPLHPSLASFFAGSAPVVGDWDGDGYDEVGIYRPSAREFIRNPHGSGGGGAVPPPEVVVIGEVGDIPLTGDRNGDSVDTPGVFRPSSGVFYLYDDWGGGLPTYTVPFGASVDIPLAGDWDGDGKDTPGVFRQSAGFFYLQDLDAPGGLIWVQMGDSTDVPITGDWNANGKDSPGVFRIVGTNGIFHLSNRESNGGGILPDLSVVFGAGGDVPVAGRWREEDPPITFTNLRLNSAHKALKAAMFFVIYIELSDDLHFGGREMPISTPTLAFEEVSRQRAEFLTTQLPCQQTPPAGSDPNLSRFDNCEDPRYMFAQTILNGMLNSERTWRRGIGGYDAVESLTGVAFSYVWANYRGTMGEESAGRVALWNVNCTYTEGGFSYDRYTDIIADRQPGSSNPPSYGYIARWLNHFLTSCQANNPNNRIWASYQNRIGVAMERAIEDFYAQLPDPTRFDWLTPNSPGAFTYKVPNYVITVAPEQTLVNVIVQNVGCRNSGITDYSPQWFENTWSNPCITPTPLAIPVGTVFKEAYSTYVPKVASTYQPDNPSILQPVLRFQPGQTNIGLTGPTPQGGFDWTSLVFQRGDFLDYAPRYQYDICTSRPDITSCLSAQFTPHVTITPRP